MEHSNYKKLMSTTMQGKLIGKLVDDLQAEAKTDRLVLSLVDYMDNFIAIFGRGPNRIEFALLKQTINERN